MGIQHTKKYYNLDFQKDVINYYLLDKSIEKAAVKFNITTRQIINILNDNNISHAIRRKIYLDQEYFIKYDDEIIGTDVMYWAGFIAADGCVMNNSKSRSYFLTIELCDKDDQHLYKFKNCLNANAKIRYKTSKSCFRINKFFKETHSSLITLNSKLMVNSLKIFNIVPKKSKIYTFPDFFENHKFINSFFRGYIDGDGSISIINNYLRISVYGTFQFLDKMSNIISKNCKIKNHNPHKNRNIYCLAYNGKEAITLIKWLYADANIYLDRKYKNIQELI